MTERLTLRACLRVAAQLTLGVTQLAAQNAAPTARPDTVVSAARARRTIYVPKSSHADTLRGSFMTRGRRWWDVTFYDLHAAVRPADSTIAG